MLPSLELLKPNHAGLEDGKPNVVAQSCQPQVCESLLLELLSWRYFPLFVGVANHQGMNSVWQIRFFSCVGMITVMKVLTFNPIFFSRQWYSEIGRDFFVALNCVVNHCGGFKVNAKQSGEVHYVIMNKSTLVSLRRDSCQSCEQHRAAAQGFPLDS